MTFIESVKVCLFRKYLTWDGRASRSEYWYFQLFLFLLGFFTGALESALPDIFELCFGMLWYIWVDIDLINSIIFVARIVVGILLFIPNLTVSARRLHDTGKSTDLAFLLLIPLGWLILLLICIKKGDEHENKYGPSPL